MSDTRIEPKPRHSSIAEVRPSSAHTKQRLVGSETAKANAHATAPVGGSETRKATHYPPAGETRKGF